MAFKSFLRRASSSIVPLCMSLPSVGTHGVSRGVISSVDKSLLIGRQFLPLSRFSTTSCEDMLSLIESDLSAYKISDDMKARDVMLVPNDFPFEIMDRISRLRSKYQNERIVIDIDCKVGVWCSPPELPMTLYITRGSQELVFELEASINRILIVSLSIRDLHAQHMEGFEKYLEIRGFTLDVSKFLLDYFGKLNLKVPDGFPFKIKDGKNPGALILKRRFQNQKIICQVFPPSELGGMLLEIKILKGQRAIIFLMTCHERDRPCHHIQSMFMRDETTEVRNWDEFRNFFEIRGIKASNINILMDCIKKQSELKGEGYEIAISSC